MGIAAASAASIAFAAYAPLREWALLIPVTGYVGYGLLFAALAEVGVDVAAWVR